MANIGGNCENVSDNIQQNNILEVFNNGYFENIQNIVVARDEVPMVGLQEAPRCEIEVNYNQFGANPPPEMNPVEDYFVQNNENSGSPLLYNPSSPQNSPGSESSTNAKPDHMNRASDLLMAVSIGAGLNKNKIIEQAVEAMEELFKLAIMGEPLWQHNGNGGMETLNGFQYLREFGSFDATMEQIMRMVEPLNIETSRETAFVEMNPMNIVQLLMDTKQWATTFYSIVSRTTLLGVILENVDGSYNGVLQVMSAEFHQRTPLIPARQCYFARYCKKHTNGTWGVVDVSLENLFPYPQVQFRRRPSGCVIQEVGNRGSKVTWIEHVEVDNRSLHPLFRPIVSSGFAFSAKRWIATINRHCQWLTTSTARTAPTTDGVLIPQEGRESLLKLAEKMTKNFFNNINSCSENVWSGLPQNFAAQDVRLRYGNILKVPGKPSGNIVIFTTSIQIPVPMEVLFDFLRHERTRNRWDLLSNQRHVRELVYVSNGENPKNRVSIMQVNSSPNKIEILYLQESYTDETGSYIVYAPMDIMAMSKILNGGNPKFVSILPSGFSIMPDKAPGQGDGAVGSILTLAFQSVDRLSNKEYMPQSTLKIIDAILSTTVASIKDAMLFGIRY
ncbi:hypothetical protein ES332_1Z018000v1 [Gossypium tomentosum]|uniref:START domain-containing protein n=1 Tax=Gossypium tomentosum TaxID=34277 RepID=A0A5C7J0Q8_GOSTO|nr:hypothetical protein ES332_1Z018000v1 [Gossypium tomentosum]